MSFEATWMDVEIIILSQTKTNIICYRLHVEPKKKRYKSTYSQNRNRLKDIENTLMVIKGERGGRDKSGV